jgi:hypothetical protein
MHTFIVELIQIGVFPSREDSGATAGIPSLIDRVTYRTIGEANQKSIDNHLRETIASLSEGKLVFIEVDAWQV